jgi:hypothetical protein
MKRHHDLLDVCVVIRRTTERAVLVDHDGKTPAWLPLAHVEVVAE